tara:strand:- start:380 stop:538 length:159 start_codon:yes stop_codon:yes gene_type:complete
MAKKMTKTAKIRALESIDQKAMKLFMDGTIDMKDANAIARISRRYVKKIKGM